MSLIKQKNVWTAIGFLIITSLVAFLLINLMMEYIFTSSMDGLLYPMSVIVGLTLVANGAYIYQTYKESKR